MTEVNPTKTVRQSQKTQGSSNGGRDLETLAKQLNEESDALRGILERLNEKLAKLNIGLEVWPYESDFSQVFLVGKCESKLAQVLSQVEDSMEKGHSTGWAVGYDKVESGWSICARPVLICERTQGEAASEILSVTADGNPVALLKAPRAIRIMAAEQLPKLIDAIKAQAESGIKAIQQARQIAERL